MDSCPLQQKSAISNKSYLHAAVSIIWRQHETVNTQLERCYFLSNTAPITSAFALIIVIFRDALIHKRFHNGNHPAAGGNVDALVVDFIGKNIKIKV